jgi:hydrogenase/urease accessory protein HupE
MDPAYVVGLLGALWDRKARQYDDLGRTVLKSNAIRFGLALALAALPAAAFAHPQVGSATGFLTGFLHPIGGLDHIIAMVAVGLWGAQLGSGCCR